MVVFRDDDASVLIIVEGRYWCVLQRVTTDLLATTLFTVGELGDPCNIHFRLAFLTMLLTVAAKQAYISGGCCLASAFATPGKDGERHGLHVLRPGFKGPRVAARCYPNFNIALVKTWDYSKKSRNHISGYKRRKLATYYDRVGRLDLLTLLGCLLAHGELPAGPLAY